MTAKNEQTLESICDESLEEACGGANTQEYKGNIGVKWKDNNVGVSGEAKTSDTDYSRCLDKMVKLPGATPSSIAAACGKPGGAK